MTSAAVALPIADARPVPIRRGYRFELIKLLAQWPIRIAFLACWLLPALLVAVISQQSSLPADTLFGRYLNQSGWAGPLVVLSVSGTWVLPILASVVAGDVFASEDRLGTWRHLLVAVRSPGRIFVAKALASLTVIIVLTAGLAISGAVGGLAAVGHQPLVGLDGHLLTSGQAASGVLLSWATVLAPTLAFAAIGLLGSVIFGRSPLGLVAPALLALLLQIAQQLPMPVAVRVALPSYGFISWRGLFTDPVQGGPVLIGVAVSLVLAVVAAAMAYHLFMRRDFTDPAYDGFGRRVVAGAVLPLAAVFALTVAVIAVATPASASGIDRTKLDHSLRTAFAHIYRMQTADLHRPAVTEAELRSRASCNKGGGQETDVGPGNDWRCVVKWRLPGSAAVGSAIYQLDVSPDGHYVADGDGPTQVNGFFQVHTSGGDIPNPLWQFNGQVNLLTATSAG